MMKVVIIVKTDQSHSTLRETVHAAGRETCWAAEAASVVPDWDSEELTAALLKLAHEERQVGAVVVHPGRLREVADAEMLSIAYVSCLFETLFITCAVVGRTAVRGSTGSRDIERGDR